MAKNLRRPQVRVTRALPRRIALTGTPGTGKSSVAALGGTAVQWTEVYAIARSHGAARRRRTGWEIDLRRLSRAMRRDRPVGTEVIVGHLAHLLPVQGAIVLRCRPEELYRRLTRARRGSPKDRRENALAEALGIVASEVRDSGIPWVEIDTTDRSAASVARCVLARLRRMPPRPLRPIDWLGDADVAEHLLDWSR